MYYYKEIKFTKIVLNVAQNTSEQVATTGSEVEPSERTGAQQALDDIKAAGYDLDLVTDPDLKGFYTDRVYAEELRLQGNYQIGLQIDEARITDQKRADEEISRIIAQLRGGSAAQAEDNSEPRDKDATEISEKEEPDHRLGAIHTVNSRYGLPKNGGPEDFVELVRTEKDASDNVTIDDIVKQIEEKSPYANPQAVIDSLTPYGSQFTPEQLLYKFKSVQNYDPNLSFNSSQTERARRNAAVKSGYWNKHRGNTTSLEYTATAQQMVGSEQEPLTNYDKDIQAIVTLGEDTAGLTMAVIMESGQDDQSRSDQLSRLQATMNQHLYQLPIDERKKWKSDAVRYLESRDDLTDSIKRLMKIRLGLQFTNEEPETPTLAQTAELTTERSATETGVAEEAVEDEPTRENFMGYAFNREIIPQAEMEKVALEIEGKTAFQNRRVGMILTMEFPSESTEKLVIPGRMIRETYTTESGTQYVRTIEPASMTGDLEVRFEEIDQNGRSIARFEYNQKTGELNGILNARTVLRGTGTYGYNNLLPNIHHDIIGQVRAELNQDQFPEDRRILINSNIKSGRSTLSFTSGSKLFGPNSYGNTHIVKTGSTGDIFSYTTTISTSASRI